MNILVYWGKTLVYKKLDVLLNMTTILYIMLKFQTVILFPSPKGQAVVSNLIELFRISEIKDVFLLPL